MTINKYIATLVKQIRECEDKAERETLQDKLIFARAYRNGALDRYRSIAIEREIGNTHTEGAQIAILFNRDAHPDEYNAYQAFRASCKSKVDENMLVLKAEIEKHIK